MEIISAHTTCHLDPPRGIFARDIKIALSSPPSDRCGTRPQWRDQHFCARATDFSLDSLPLPHLPRRFLPFNAHIKQPEYLRIAGLLLNCSGWMIIAAAVCTIIYFIMEVTD